MGECCSTPSKFNKVISSIEVASSSGNNVLRSPVSAFLVVRTCETTHNSYLIRDTDNTGKVRWIEHMRTSGMTTKAANSTDMTKFTQNNQRRNVKYDATTVPNCDSISLMVNSQGIIWLMKLAISRLLCCHCYALSCKTLNRSELQQRSHGSLLMIWRVRFTRCKQNLYLTELRQSSNVDDYLKRLYLYCLFFINFKSITRNDHQKSTV